MGFAGLLGSYRYPPDAPDGFNGAAPPQPSGVSRRTFARLKWTDPTVQAVIRQQDRWYAWRSRQVWNAAWADSHRLWERTWRGFTDELRTILDEFRERAATGAQQFVQRSRELRQAASALGSSYLLPVDDETGVERTCDAVLDGLGGHLAPGVREGDILGVIVDGNTWHSAYQEGRSNPQRRSSWSSKWCGTP